MWLWRNHDDKVEIEAENFRFVPEDGPFDEGSFRREIEGVGEGEMEASWGDEGEVG